MPDFRPMLSNKILYNRLINCIVSNSYLRYFISMNVLPIEIINMCLNSMYKVANNKNKRVLDFICQVELYRDTIIHNCKEFSVDNSMIFESPRQELEERIFQYLDSKMSVIMRKNKSGQSPKSVPIVVMKQAAMHVNKLSLEYNSSDDYLKYVFSVYQVVGRKWWQSRVANGENVAPDVNEAGDSMVSPSSLKRTYPFNELPLKKRILKNLEFQHIFPNEIHGKTEPFQNIEEVNTKQGKPKTAEYKIIAYNRPSLTITIQKRNASSLRRPS